MIGPDARGGGALPPTLILASFFARFDRRPLAGLSLVALIEATAGFGSFFVDKLARRLREADAGDGGCGGDEVAVELRGRCEGSVVSS